MDVFGLRQHLIEDYSSYVRSFFKITDERIKGKVERALDDGLLWPEPLIQLNPSFESGKTVDELVQEGILHAECGKIFRKGKDDHHIGQSIRLFKHQEEAVRIALKNENYVLTTGTGSGKSLCYIIPIVNQVLQSGVNSKIKAIIVYPMNALANSQKGELEKFLVKGYPEGQSPVTFQRYTGQESDQEKREIIANPPDILLTNYVMLELILTRPEEKNMIQAAQGLQFLVFDELHTYRGRQGADVALLIRRARNALEAPNVQCVGTSATIAGTGSYDEQCAEVARVASIIFGTEIKKENVIGESLKQVCRANPVMPEEEFYTALKKRVGDYFDNPPTRFEAFIQDPLSAWLEKTFGVEEDTNSRRLQRARPKSIRGAHGAAELLSRQTGFPQDRCAAVIERGLLAGCECQPEDDTGSSPFAFRLHQFISRGDTVYASLEMESSRYMSVFPQYLCPEDRNKVLFPLLFCRECGQEYYSVWKTQDSKTGPTRFEPRPIMNQLVQEEGESGYLYIRTDENAWTYTPDDLAKCLPDDWLEEHGNSVAIRRDRKKKIPQAFTVSADGTVSASGVSCWYIPAPFLFCLNCLISYTARMGDFSKLTSLNSGGRSTSTTILSLSVIRHLKKQKEQNLTNLAPEKLLSFTDNRQDASLQAGHFNDFIEIGLLRSALYRAVQKAGPGGIRHDELTLRVFESLALPFADYASDPHARFQAQKDTDHALREFLGYRLYRDLKRGWRITLPNLEQCGLLQIQYLSLDELCQAEEEWRDTHDALQGASPTIREDICKVFLDFIRRELAIKVNYLESKYQETIKQKSYQKLKAPWALEENESMEAATILLPRKRSKPDTKYFVFVSPRSGFGQFLRRATTFGDSMRKISVDETAIIIRQLLDKLQVAGIVARVMEPRNDEEVPGYQLDASALVWKEGDGTQSFHDPIRIPNPPEEGLRTNPYFVEYYRNGAKQCRGIHAREHTAQVRSDLREEREKDFRSGTLPILYCSPTMELGVDIAELNVVNMRNVPPTPANYAQRSGRAGRGGQPALVFTYCTTGSSHDQYYYKRPSLMVSGAVKPPRLDLANEDLLRSHIQAIWLSETGLSLGHSLKDILDLEGENPSLHLLDSVRHAIQNPEAKHRALKRAAEVLSTIQSELRASDWYRDDWLEEIIGNVEETFDRASDRWRGLYKSALAQARAQDKVIRDPTRTEDDRRKAEAIRREAESQLKILSEEKPLFQSDFYSYRYFASEGFLPGYSFPRLPLSAYIPGQRNKDEYLSRPRFLAITEFGPRALIYHEGSKYQINRVILPIESEESITLSSLKQCPACGYLHKIESGQSYDICERCGMPLDCILRNLFRLQNVSTRRRDRINADEEERMRFGYEIKTGFRFSQRGGFPTYRVAQLMYDGENLGRITYDQATTIWRINLGWSRRENREQHGFNLDVERGYWGTNKLDLDDVEDPYSRRITRVIPYVEDRRNSLLFEPAGDIELPFIASLKSALKNAIQFYYQLEDNELAVESLPDPHTPRMFLCYEAAEGGAGVLRRLVEDPHAFSAIARAALELCHYDPDSGEDKRRHERSQEDCEAACYDCLMHYGNQPDHSCLNRKLLRDYLLKCVKAKVFHSPGPKTRAAHLDYLMKNAGSELERKWLRFLEDHSLNLPDDCQKLYESCGTRPDFNYGNDAVIYVDGPPHDFPDRQKRDREQERALDDCGIKVIRFHHEADWAAIIAQHPSIFGKLQ
ncbi:MAG: DEAD/DEAH box helicase [bacterium]